MFIIYKQVLTILGTENIKEYLNNKEILEEYAKEYTNAINDYYKSYQAIPTHEEIKDNIKYYKNNVSCNINIIYKDKSIYLNECKINDKTTNLKYGERKEEIDENGLLKNEYYIDYKFMYVNETNDFSAKSKQDVDNIIYTILNSGVNSFSFECNYDTCIEYINTLMNDEHSLSHMNYFIHPYNTYKKIIIEHNNIDKVTLTIIKRYNEKEINYVNSIIDKIIDENIDETKSNTEKIRIIHDFIINNSRYATDEIRDNNPDVKYNTAYDILTTGYGLCMSYADFMSIALDKLNIKNYQIASETHVWNLVYLDGTWYHLDATWNDPVTSDGSNVLEYTYFLITDNKLKSLGIEEHDYDPNIALELAN